MILATTKLANSSNPSCPREKVLDIPDQVDQAQVLMDLTPEDHHHSQDLEGIETLSRILSFSSSEHRSWLTGSSPGTSLFLRR